MSRIIKTLKQNEAIKLMSQNKITLLEGGSRCFYKDQKVVTDSGLVSISQIKPFTRVLSYNESKKKEEFKPVLKTHIFKDNKKDIIKIKLKNGGEIKGTFDHLIFFENKWTTLGEVKKLYESRMENDPGVYSVSNKQ